MSFETYEKSYGLVTQSETEPHNCIEIDGDENFQQYLSDYNIVVVDVWANFCSPCKMIAPYYEKLALKYQSSSEKKDIIFLKDCIDDDSITSVHGDQVNVIPTFFIYVMGRLIGTIMGGDFKKMETILDNLLPADTSVIIEKDKHYSSTIEKIYQDGILQPVEKKEVTEIKDLNLGVC